MTWEEMGRLAHLASERYWSQLDSRLGYCTSTQPWESLSQDGKHHWVDVAKAIYNAAAGDLAARIGQEGL